jgi:hypothetical protein
LQKAHDRDWLRRLKSSGQAESAYIAFRLSSADSSTTDRVLDTAFAILLALLVRDQRMVEPLFRLGPTDVEREKRKRGRDSQESMSQGSSLKRSVSMSAASERRTLTAEGSFVSSSSYSSSPRKAEAEADERSDLLEVLKELSEREWAREEIGSAQDGGTDGLAGKKAKVLKGEARHVSNTSSACADRTSDKLVAHSCNRSATSSTRPPSSRNRRFRRPCKASSSSPSAPFRSSRLAQSSSRST